MNGLALHNILQSTKFIMDNNCAYMQGGVAQMVERSLSMREVPGSIPGISILFMI